MLVAGIDPGMNGGCAIVSIGESTEIVRTIFGYNPKIIDAIDIPILGEGAKRRVYASELFCWLREYEIRHAFVERAGAMPHQGVSGMFRYGRAVGAIEAVIQCAGIPMTLIEPRTWKKHYGLPGGQGNKETARQRAIQLFPASGSLLARKRDHGRAEAALLALYGATKVAP